MHFFAVASIALISLVGGGPQMSDALSAEAVRLLALLPVEAQGWKGDGADQAFDRETIFEYIDGSGEVFRAFDMRLLVSRRYKNPGRADVVIDFFDMGSSADAFGVFSHDLEGEDWGLGQGSLYKGGLLQFWRGRYFVSLFAESENPETTAVLAEMGKAVAAAAGPDGPKPDLVGFVPEKWRGGQVRYFHNPQILNYHFYVGSENVLNLGPEAAGVLAIIGAKAEKRACLIVRYKDEAGAEAARTGFLRVYSPETIAPETAGERAQGLIRLKDGRFAAAGRAGRFFCAVFGEPAADSALAAWKEAAADLE